MSRAFRLTDVQLQEVVGRTRGVASSVGGVAVGIADKAPAAARAKEPPEPKDPVVRKRAPASAPAAPKLYEDDLQISCFELIEVLRGQHPILEWVVHVPNGGKRPRGAAGRLKAMGVKKGVLDVILPLPYNGWSGWAIELKVGKNRTTEEQDNWLAALEAAGYYTAVCYSLEEFERHLILFLRGRAPHQAAQVAQRLEQFLRDRRAPG